MSAYQEYFDANHQLLRDSVRRFVEREILPFVAEWEEAESFPRELYAKAGAAGILGIGYPEQFGGSHEGDLFAAVVEAAGEGAVEKHGRKIPPYRETQDYVRKVLSEYALLRGVSAQQAVQPPPGKDVL